MNMKSERYTRQMLVNELGEKGQDILASKHVVIIGGGGLGSNSANIFVRMGIGRVDIVDDDIVEITNLHRTSIFAEEDVGRTKVYVLENKLKKINEDVTVKGVQQRVTKENVESLINKSDVIVDGTDNMELRFLLNDAAVKHGIPWVYAGVYSTLGMVMGIIPKKTPCLRCISQNIPDMGKAENPVLGSLPVTVASIQSNETIKLLLGEQPAGLIIYDVWRQHFETMAVKKNQTCPCCKKNQFKYL